MSRILFECATPLDDPALRHLTASVAMEGHIDIRYHREPSYFAAAEVEGETVTTSVAREPDSRRIVGMGTRSEKSMFVNGEAGRVGYLSGLRGMPEVRNGLLLARAYRHLRSVHEQGAVPFYLSTILEDNLVAQRILTSGRAGLPTYRDMGRFCTLAIGTARPARKLPETSLDIDYAEEKDRSSVVHFLTSEGRKRQFFPIYQEDHFVSPTGLLRGLPIDDVLVAKLNGTIVGTLALWDQTPFRQSKVHGYARPIRWIRRPYNLYATFAGTPRLVPADETLRYLMLALCCVKDDVPEVFHALLCTALRESYFWKRDFAVLGLHERDPLLTIAMQQPHRLYSSRMYGVYWEDGEAAFTDVDDRIPYLETGAL